MSRKSLFPETGQWYKGNTHLHTTLSDGFMNPAEAVKAYRDADYSFLVITDHWYYGNHKELETEDFLVFAGVEIDTFLDWRAGEGICHHVTAMADPYETPYRSGDRLEDLRETGDMAAMVDKLNRTGHICIYAHPEWSHVKMEEYDKIASRCAGVEVYNNVCELMSGAGYSTSYFNRGLWENRPKLAFSADDTHWPKWALGGFICVKAEHLTHRDILDAIRAGRFYASTGPAIRDFYVEDGVAHVECSPCTDIEFFTDAAPAWREVCNQPGSTRASYRLPEGARGVYAVCRDGEKRAWTQILRL